ncbi:MAG: hypothetical protein ACO3EE_07845 [Flavobacteriales bacterium]
MKKTFFALTILVMTGIISLHYSCKRETVFYKNYSLNINVNLPKDIYHVMFYNTFFQSNFCQDNDNTCKDVFDAYLNGSFQSVKGNAGVSINYGINDSKLQFNPCVNDGDLAGCIVEVLQGDEIVGTFDYSEKIASLSNFKNSDIYKPIIKVSVPLEKGTKLTVYVNYKSKKNTAYYKLNEDIDDLDLVYIASGVKSFNFSASETEYPVDLSMEYIGTYRNGCQNGQLLKYQ